MQPDNREQELFYKLSQTELAKICRLKPAEMKIYLYLKTLDPFGNTYHELDLENLKEVTGIRSLGSIYPAMAHLHELGLIRWVVSKSYVHVMDQSTDPKIRKLIHRSVERSEDQKIDPWISGVKNQELEPLLGTDSESPQINKTNKNNQIRETNKNACEGLEEDPEYESWIDRAIDSLPHPPQGAYRARLKKKELQDTTNQKEFLEWRQKQGRGSNFPPPPPQHFETISIDALPGTNEYWDRIYSRMAGGAS